MPSMGRYWIPVIVSISVTMLFFGLYFYVPPKFGGIPQRAVRNIVQDFHTDDHVFADARRKCREEIRNMEPDASFGNAENRRSNDSVIIRLDWETKASHRSYCRVIDGQVAQITIDNAIAYGRE